MRFVSFRGLTIGACLRNAPVLHFFCSVAQLPRHADSGLETGQRQEAAYVVKQGTITFVLASPIKPGHPDAYRLDVHGDGVQDIAIVVDDVKKAYDEAVARGAVGVKPPAEVEDGASGIYRSATIKSHGDTTHTFVDRSQYKGVFAPGFKALDSGRYGDSQLPPVGLLEIDHAVANVELGKMNGGHRRFV